MSTVNIVEFLMMLLIAASLVALASSRLNIPYTIALVLCGLFIDFLHIPIAEILGEGKGPEHVLTPDIIFALFLPALLFEAGININIRHLRDNIAPIAILAVAGVLAAAVITGLAVHWGVGLPLLVALTFGALIVATDPISVLALFRDLGVDKRLSVIVEGESLFNDGTAVVVFQIFLAGAVTGSFSITGGITRFLVEALGGAAVGLGLGYLVSRLTEKVDDPRIEITFTTILAYGSYLLAHHLHTSGVIATVAAGLMVGNFGAEFGMSARTRVALWTFWEYLAFVINSIVFLLIGLEVHIFDLLDAWKAILLAIAAVLAGRAATVYLLTPVANLFSEKIGLKWQHVLVWGGVHGSVSMALALSLAPDFPHRAQIMAMTFGVVAFSLVVQGFTVKPLLKALGIQGSTENEYDRAMVRQIALHAARTELEALLRDHLLSRSVFESIREELDGSLDEIEDEITQLQVQDPELAEDEERLARRRLIMAEKHAIQRSANDGLLSTHTAENLLAAADERLEALRHPEETPEEEVEP